MGLFVALWKTEEGAQDIIQIIQQSPGNLQLTYHGDYQIFLFKEPSEGIILPHSIQKVYL